MEQLNKVEKIVEALTQCIAWARENPTESIQELKDCETFWESTAGFEFSISSDFFCEVESLIKILSNASESAKSLRTTACVDDDFPTRMKAFDHALSSCEGTYDFFDLISHLGNQMDFSIKTFGPGDRTKGVIDHIRKELKEIEEAQCLDEWVDVILLALDGAWRCGATPTEICQGIAKKQKINEKRKWPDWRTADKDKAIEHHPV